MSEINNIIILYLRNGKIPGLIFLLILSILISGLFTGFRAISHWVGTSLIGPSWNHFLGGSLSIFIFLFMYSLGLYILCQYRFYKDPSFKNIHTETGISWKNYKRLKRKHE